jgi:aspartate aminotransferase
MDIDKLKKGSELFYKLVEESFALERAGKKLIKLHIGSTGLPVPECAVKVLNDFKLGSLAPYGPGPGLLSFREAAAKREGVGTDQIVVGPGSKFLIFSLLLQLKDSISELVITAPFWPAYILMAETLGIKIRIVETKLENNWAIPPLELKKNSVVMLCSPLNPTSTIFDSKDLAKIQEEVTATSSHLIVDEAYRGLSFTPIESVGDVRIRSFSKEFNLEGWRLGYAILPADLAKKLTSIIHISNSCTSSLIQNLGLSCLENQEQILKTHVEIWKIRLAALTSALRESGFKFSEPQSGMYVFATHPRLIDCEKFCKDALEKGVVVSPGSAFGPYENFVRISASAEAEELVKAVGVLRQVL